MKIGTIGYSNNSGLGVMLKFFRKHLSIDSQLVISWEAKGTNLNDLKCKFVITPKENPTKEALEEFIGFKPDVVLMTEYPFCWDYLKRLKEKGIKIIYIPMLDSIGINILEKYKDFVDLWLCVNKWSFDLINYQGWNCYYLPYPIDTNYFQFNQRGKEKILLHNAGYVGLGCRKGTDLVLKAFQEVRKIRDVKLIVNSQVPLEQYGDLGGVDVRIGEKYEIRDIYQEGNIYLAPSRFEGLGLTIPEAMSCGFPVITTDAPPMNELITDERFLIRSNWMLLNPFSNAPIYFEPNFEDFISKIQFALDTDLCDTSIHNRCVIERRSWKELKPRYLDLFQKVVNGENL